MTKDLFSGQEEQYHACWEGKLWKATERARMEKTNLVLETGLRTGRAQGAVGVHEPICSTCRAWNLPNPDSNLSPVGHETGPCVAHAVRPDVAAWP